MRYLDFSNTSIAEGFRMTPEDFQDCFWSDTKFRMMEFYKQVIGEFMEEEVNMLVGAKKHERKKDRLVSRNGYRNKKSLLTEIGAVKDIPIPCLEGGIFRTRIFQPYQRRTNQFDHAVLNLYVHGQTTRRISRSFYRIFGGKFSHDMVSKILQKLQQHLDAWRQKRIDKSFMAIVLDGVWLNVRTIPKYIKKGLKKGTKAVILAVMGITRDGAREILGFKLAYSESEAEWEGLLNNLVERGLKLDQDGLAIHDDCAGIKAAIDRAFAYCRNQLCVFHFLQSAGKKASGKEASESVRKDLAYVYQIATNGKQAESEIKSFLKKWREYEPAVCNYVQKNFLDTITYLKYDKIYHNAFKTTNYLERSFRQIKRKIRDVGIFPNAYSAERIVYLEIIELNHRLTGVKPFYA